MSDLIFEDPAPKNSSPHNPPRFWVSHLAPLRDHYGEWAVVKITTPGAATVCASNLRSGVIGKGLDVDEWEFTSRADGDVGKVYARFLGGAL